MIEEHLQRITTAIVKLTDAINENTAAVNAAAGNATSPVTIEGEAQVQVPEEKEKAPPKKKAAKKKAAKKPAESKHTAAEVRAVLTKLTRDDAKDVLAECGVVKLSELPVTLFDKAVLEAEAKLAAAEGEEEEEEEEDLLS